MPPVRTDILISGGGIAGLTAAAAFARAGRSVVLADPAPPPPAAGADGSDLRSTAFLGPAIALFREVGLWEALSPHAARLDTLRVVDTVGWPPMIRDERAFRAQDVTDGPFGWNLPNWLTRKLLVERLSDFPNVELRLGTGFAGLLTRESGAFVRLTDGTRVEARLVVGADGRASAAREAAGIDVDVTRYGQKALAFEVTHPHPHGSTSTELYNEGGAFVLVPLPDHKGGPASAVVWMERGPRALELAALDPRALGALATERSCGILGQLELASPVRVWPVVTQVARRLTAERTALVAEAAHVLPPIGAQGLNTSLQDVAALARIISETDDPGSPAVLRAYEKARAADVHMRARVIDLFNRVCRSGEAPLQALRLGGLRVVHDVAPLRRAVMQAGLGRADQGPVQST
jgi:2-octaprenyl-6-methoxyphenol hydroxylase